MARLLAIGDIHGCSRALDALLLAVKLTPHDRLVMLGDYVDRGPDSRGVLERILALHASFAIVALRGNHEMMMLAARKNEASLQFWMTVGGREAMASYVPAVEAGRPDEVPEAHWRFLRTTCVDWYETESHFFVHANVDPDLPLEHQPSSMLHWEHFSQWCPPHQSGKVMVCGHSEQRHGWPLVLPHAICLDTYCYGGGWLTCLDVLSGRVWQANQIGATRGGWIDESGPR
jgi:diadenosine tetraphosphatase ApaH/serine/threonine PP2A family protein phosphatase